MTQTDLVTGAFSFTGSFVAELLLQRGHTLRTLTGHPNPAHPLADRVDTRAFCFDDPVALAEHLKGVHTLYNTYWVRFDHGRNTYEGAVHNTQVLFRAARDAGVQRIVHVSIANPSLNSSLPYYRGKAQLEEDLQELGVDFAILRPTVIFGEGGLLINNIGWLLRRFPLFAVVGDGEYRMQPVFVEDLAELMVDAGASRENTVIDAVGPETYSYLELVKLVREMTGSRSKIVHVGPRLGYALGRMLGWVVRDVLITREEIVGLLDDLLVSHESPRCRTSFRQWLERSRGVVGRGYISELDLHYK
ncbi:MAG: NAD(P)H-binding protein [Deltaproteobacteria bacterium]|nr:NAD(P)H-binding protein [Deltaproteobacteria bacterium]MBW2418711.1 NAD(P)H-binding protein [Deltaproteobacteria bacterium]